MNHPLRITSSPCEVALEEIMGQQNGPDGPDLVAVNSARVSFGVESQELQKKDKRLLRYLAKHKHFSPFRHIMVRLRIRAPEFVMRQLYKHVVGIEGTSTYATKDHAWNEISGRYKPYEEFYCPEALFKQHPSAKQCSSEEEVEGQAELLGKFRGVMEASIRTYRELIERGVAKEQARILLPLSFVTEVVWTASLQAIQNFVVLRNSTDAQWEIRHLAQQICALVTEKCPASFGALMEFSQ